MKSQVSTVQSRVVSGEIASYLSIFSGWKLVEISWKNSTWSLQTALRKKHAVYFQNIYASFKLIDNRVTVEKVTYCMPNTLLLLFCVLHSTVKNWRNKQNVKNRRTRNLRQPWWKVNYLSCSVLTVADLKKIFKQWSSMIQGKISAVVP